ncbi:MAG: hypothetical protein FWC56_01020, partial [Phycisphaerae bacterium]|nr:hypothetical protein [Phycisphaerae bacterium]
MLLATGLWVGVVSIPALAIVVIDGGQAVGIIVVAALAGGWLVYPLGLGRCRWSDRLMIGAGLGVGLLSLVVLTLGSASWLTRPVAFGLVAVVAIAGVARFAMDLRAALLLVRLSASSNEISRRSTIVLQSFHYLWLLTIPFFAITLLAASIPPGVLWAEEACGYDVLEYHLAVPREFFEAGHIGFLPHNVYSNFPMNSEMLSLLMMSWQGSAIDAVFLVQMANVAMAVLFVAAAWWAGRCFSSKAGVVAGVLAAMTPWLAYLAGVAYVEPGMLAMGMLSLGAVLRAGREASTASIPASRWIIAAGLLAGLSAGDKYTAIPLIVVPIATVLLFMLGGGPVSSRSAEACSARRMPAVQLDAVYHVPITGPGIAWPWRWAARFKFVAIFSFAAVVAFSPWMIRNFIHTHDPIFPLAYSVIGAKAGTWDDESQARWQYAHGWAGSGLDPNESRIRAIWQRTAGDARMGAVLPWLAVAGMFVRRDRWTLALLVMLALQFGVWLFATHLFARFAVVFVLPLLLLAARFAEACRSRVTTIVLGLVLVAGAVLHG